MLADASSRSATRFRCPAAEIPTHTPLIHPRSRLAHPPDAADQLPSVEWISTHAPLDSSEVQRLTTVAAFPITAQKHCIVTCNSEGTVRFFCVDAKAGACWCVCEQHFAGKCILSCDVFHHAAPSGHVTHLLACGSTDGRIVVWDCTDVVDACVAADHEQSAPITWNADLSKVLQYQAHKMGVNCLVMKPCRDESASNVCCVVISGGDDQALSVAGLRAPDASAPPAQACVELAYLERVIDCSSCSINGIDSDGRTIFCAGCDQRMDVWALEPPPNFSTSADVPPIAPSAAQCLRQCGACCMELPDVGDLSALEDSDGQFHVVAVGEGMQRVHWHI